MKTDAFLEKRAHLWSIKKMRPSIFGQPLSANYKISSKTLIITLVTSECYHLYFREGIFKMNRLPIFENYENTAILRAIDSVKRDATFGTAHLIIGANTAPDNPPAWTSTVQVIVVLPLTSSAVK